MKCSEQIISTFFCNKQIHKYSWSCGETRYIIDYGLNKQYRQYLYTITEYTHQRVKFILFPTQLNKRKQIKTVLNHDRQRLHYIQGSEGGSKGNKGNESKVPQDCQLSVTPGTKNSLNNIK